MTDRKPCYTELMEDYKVWAEQKLKDIPEARGLMLVVDWNVGNSELPPCSVVCRELNEYTSVSMMQQGLKLLDYLATLFRQKLSSVTSIIAKAEALIKQNSQPDKS